jgi:hypothetical protein
MPAVLVALGRRLNSEILLPDVERLRAARLDVHLVTWAPPSPELAAAVGDVVVLGHGLRGESASAPGAEGGASAQEVLEHAEESLLAGDLTGSELLEESLESGDDTEDEEDASDELPPPPPPRVKATGPGRVVQVAFRAARTPRPYAARVYVLARRRSRPLRRKLRRRTQNLRANVHRPRATTVFLRNAEVRRLIADADLLVAVDSSSVLAVWTVVRGRDDLQGVVGVDAALAHEGVSSGTD